MQTTHSYSFDLIPDLDGLMEIPKHVGPWIKPYIELALDVLFRLLRHPEIDEAAEVVSLDWFQPLSEPVFGRPAIQHQSVFMPLA